MSERPRLGQRWTSADTCGMRIGGSPSPGSPQPGSHATGSSPASGAASSAWPDPAASAAEPCPRCGTPRNGQFCEAFGHNFVGPPLHPHHRVRPRAVRPPRLQPEPALVLGPAPPVSGQPRSRSGGYSSCPGAAPGGRPRRHPLQPVPSAPPAPASPSMSSFPYPQATWTAVVGADRAYYEQCRRLPGRKARPSPSPPTTDRTPFPARRETRCGSGGAAYRAAWPPEIDLTGPPADPGISRLHAVLIATPDGKLGRARSGFGQRHAGQRFGDRRRRTRYPCTTGDRINLGAWTAITVHRG